MHINKQVITNPIDIDYSFWLILMGKGGPRGVVANVLDCNIIVSEFDLWSFYYIHFWINTLGKV